MDAQTLDVSNALYEVESALAGRAIAQGLPPPCTLGRDAWPPDYARVLAWRRQQLALFERDPNLLESARLWYAGDDLARRGIEDAAQWAARSSAFINHWCDTYDPRNAGKPGKRVQMPLVMFPRQAELVEFVLACMLQDASGLVEKSRSMGATWTCVSVTTWLWLFSPGVAVGWGANKLELVDVLGDPDTIMEKLRNQIRLLPDCFRPPVEDGVHLKHTVCRNPVNSAVVSGQGGKNIGRGGRRRIYFVDEAQPLDARLLTPQGFVTMADARVGMRVIGPDGTPRTVTQVKDCGVYDVYRITLSDGTWTECSPNHLWTVENVVGKHERKTMRTRSLANDLTNRYGQYKYRLPHRPVVAFVAQSEPLPLHPYIVGALLGNGALAEDGATKFTTPDAELVDEFRRLMPEGCLLNEASYSPIEFRFVDAIGRHHKGRYVRSAAKQAVVAVGIAGLRSWEKFIPERYLLSSPEERLALLQGLMDTDGYGVGTSFHTSSPHLADDVRFLVQSLGGSATLRVAPSKAGFRTMYALTIRLDGMDLFRTSRKRNRRSPRKWDVGRTIFSAAIVGRRPVRCISVDAQDGLYLTDHCIITHNSAHLEQPVAIEAALSENTRCRVDISSVSQPGTVYHRKRLAGVEWTPGAAPTKDAVNVFVMDWSDHPEKTQEWYAERRRFYEGQGTPEVVAREIDRDYMGAAEGIIIKYEWVEAAVDAHKRLPGFDASGGWWGGLDVADEGVDTNALVRGRGLVVKHAEEWGERDPGATARRAFRLCRDTAPIQLQYDCIGLGTNIKSEFNRLGDDASEGVAKIRLVPWNAGARVLDPGEPVIASDRESPTNKNYFENFKAQAWWNVSRMFYNTWRAVRALDDGGGEVDDEEEGGDSASAVPLISLDSSSIPQATLAKLMRELSQATMGQSSRLKLLVNKAPSGAKSPNLADALVMGRYPARPASSGMGMLGGPGTFGPKVFVG